MESYRIGFVIEQTMGHSSHQRYLARCAAEDASIVPTWMSIPCGWEDHWVRWPILRTSMSLLLSVRAREQLRRASRKTPYDALFFHTQSTALFSIGLASRIPVVVSLDATPLNMDSVAAGYGHQPDSRGLSSHLKYQWYRRLFQQAAALVTWSHWARNSLVDDYHIAAEKVAVIPPGLDLDTWPRPWRERGVAQPVRLLFVGADFARKGGHVLMEAFKAELAGDCELDIVTGDEVQTGGPVRVHRRLTHDDPALSRLFVEADLLILPTLADCSPLAIIEAMASGLAVVTTGVGAIPEQVIDGVTGLLVPPGDAGALARAVRALVADPARRAALAAAGRCRAEQLFDGARNYRALADLLKRCIAGHTAQRPTTGVGASLSSTA